MRRYPDMSHLIAEHARYLKVGCAESTITARTRLLWRLHHYLPDGLGTAAQGQIEAFLAELHDAGRGPATLANYAMHIRAFFRWADAMGKLDGDPTLGMYRPPQRKFRPKPCDDQQQIEKALSSPEPWRTIYALAYYEGMRAFEIAAARREDITEETTFIARAKGGDPGVVPTHPYVWALVRDRPPGRLFPHGPRKGKVDGRWVSQEARRQFRRLGLPGLHVHRLRHSFATDQLVAGADVRTVQENLRHATLATTVVYLETTSARKRAAIELLPTLIAVPASA